MSNYQNFNIITYFGFKKIFLLGFFSRIRFYMLKWRMCFKHLEDMYAWSSPFPTDAGIFTSRYFELLLAIQFLHSFLEHTNPIIKTRS